MARDLGWNASVSGVVQSAFFFGWVSCTWMVSKLAYEQKIETWKSYICVASEWIYIVTCLFFLVIPWRYTIAQLPSGLLVNRFKGINVLPIGVFLWSAATVGIPFAARHGNGDVNGDFFSIASALSLLVFCRFLVGLGEGTSPSSAVNIVAESVPKDQRGRATTLVFGSLNAGSVIGLLLVRMAFVVKLLTQQMCRFE